jgi:predicted nuclease of restriction endonuclease-like (RecB) superfamily
MEQNIAMDKQYKAWITGLKDRIQGAQIKAAIAVNRELLRFYWELGKDIVEKQKVTNWGEGLVEQLSKDLSSAFPGTTGFSRANLFFIRKWYLFYNQNEKVSQPVRQMKGRQHTDFQFENGKSSVEVEKVSQLVAQIPWGHNREIISKCGNVDEALFYVKGTIQNNWSRAVLMFQIESGLYGRQGKAIHNFHETLPDPQAELARETLKNPYNFEFMNMSKAEKEKDFEEALTQHIQKFLLELGQGFAFMGRQFRLNVEGDDFYMDLLFYHTRLRCHVVVEIKCTEFKPEYVGKLNFYCNVVDAQMKQSHENPTLGILLCKSPKRTVVEYSLKNVATPLGVSEYQLIKAVGQLEAAVND